MARKWIAEGEPADKVERQVKNLRLSFEPADIVNEVMSFGSPTPIEVVVSGPKMADNRAYAAKICTSNSRRCRRCATCSTANRSTTRPSKCRSTGRRRR